MKKLLIISFDLIRKGENEKSLAISSLLAYLKNDKGYGNEYTLNHLPFNMYKFNKDSNIDNLKDDISLYDILKYDYIAISAYIWNEYLIKDLIDYLKTILKFKGKIILGGYQISYSNNPEKEYENCNYFISGYAEKSLLDIIKGVVNSNRVNSNFELSELPSPYLTKELPIKNNQKAVRFETKRGCPYRCSFCAHRDLTFNKVYKHNLERVYNELSLFKKLNVKKINVIDPIFNSGKEYIYVLRKMIELNIKSKISIQTRFETIKGEKGKLFLELCEKLNINLEFGLQTSNENESKIINRQNNPNHIIEVMNVLNNKNIDYEISLIYGLPTQTLQSFKNSITFVKNNGCVNLTAFPLMLLKGTELYHQKEKYMLKEKELGEYNIPTVISSNSFTEMEWKEMEKIANELKDNNRI